MNLIDHIRAPVNDRRVFLDSPVGAVTYGDLRAHPGSGRPHVVTGVSRPADFVDLLCRSGPGSPVAVIDPGLPDHEAARRRAVALTVSDDETALILFTSGTTSEARGVRSTVGNWMAATSASASHLDHGADDVWLACMPLHHVGGLSILLRSAAVGASIRWQPRFEATAAAEALRSEVTMASFVPTMLRRILDTDTDDFGGLKVVLVGGGPIQLGLLEEARSRGIPAVPTYGMTETCAQVATLRTAAPLEYAVEPLPGVDLKLDHDGRISVRGHQVFRGYVGEGDRDGDDWFVTSDIGEWSETGLLRVLGRTDDVIITGGENVHPARVEALLRSHPDVAAVVVVGVPDDEWGEAVVAVFEGTADPSDLVGWASENLSAAETPKRAVRVDELPHGSLDKPDRRAVVSLVTALGP